MGTTEQALEKADELAGSRAALARIAGVSKQAAYKWRAIPPEHCRKIEAALDARLTRYEMRPDIFGEQPDVEAA